MSMLQGNTYLMPIRIEDCDGNVIVAEQVEKGEFVFGDIFKFYGADGEVYWSDEEKAFILPLGEEETFKLRKAVKYQGRVLLKNGAVSGSVPQSEYIYESIGTTILSSGESVGEESGKMLTIKLLERVGGGGTTDYNKLENKPSINGVVLEGDKTTEDLGIVSEEVDPTVPQHIKNITEQNIDDWNNKADAEDIENLQEQIDNLGNVVVEETDPTVPQYVKEITEQDIQEWNNKANKSELPTKVSQLQNDINLASQDYVNTKVADLVNSAPETLDTLGEVAKAIEENADVVEALNSAVGNKANKSELAEYVKNTDYATNEKAGITRIDQTFGIRMGGNNQDVAVIVPATNSQIDGGTDQYHPIVPNTLKYGVEKYATQKEIVDPSYMTGFNNDIVKSNVVKLKSYSLSVPRYYKLCEFLAQTNQNNYSSISIEGRMGGWVSTDMAQWEILFSNRNSYASVSSVLSLSSKDGLTICDLVVYEQEDKSCIMYLKCFQYYTTNFEISTVNCNNVYDGTFTTEEPSGTLKWSLSTSDYVKINALGSGANIDTSNLVTKEEFEKVYNKTTDTLKATNIELNGEDLASKIENASGVGGVTVSGKPTVVNFYSDPQTQINDLRENQLEKAVYTVSFDTYLETGEIKFVTENITTEAFQRIFNKTQVVQCVVTFRNSSGSADYVVYTNFQGLYGDENGEISHLLFVGHIDTGESTKTLFVKLNSGNTVSYEIKDDSASGGGAGIQAFDMTLLENTTESVFSFTYEDVQQSVMQGKYITLMVTLVANEEPTDMAIIPFTGVDISSMGIVFSGILDHDYVLEIMILPDNTATWRKYKVATSSGSFMDFIVEINEDTNETNLQFTYEDLAQQIGVGKQVTLMVNTMSGNEQTGMYVVPFTSGEGSVNGLVFSSIVNNGDIVEVMILPDNTATWKKYKIATIQE